MTNCDIVRDLLPVYVEGLSSEATNSLVMEHLQGCNSCREVLDNMKRPIIVEREPKKEINYLGKIRKKIKKSYLISIIAVAVLALTIAALFIKNSIIGDLSSFTDISINWSYSEETDSIILNGKLLNGMAVSRVQVSPAKGNTSLVQVNVYGVTPFLYTNKTFSVSIPWQDDIRIELRDSNSQQHKIMDSLDLYPTVNLFQGDLWVKGGMLADKYALENIKSILFDTIESEIAFYKHLEKFYQGSKANALPNVPEYLEIIYSTSSSNYSLDYGLFLGVTVYVYEQSGTYFVKMADQIKEISVDDYNTLVRYLDLFTANNEVYKEPQGNGTEALAGFIEIQNNKLHITPVEVFATYDENADSGWHTTSELTLRAIELIEINDIQKMRDFGLTQEDFPSGIHIRPNWHSEKQWYYVEQANIETLEFEITDETLYTFVDNNLLFIDEPNGTRQYSTTILNEFLQYFSPTVIHIIEVKDGKVIRLVQEFAFTI